VSFKYDLFLARAVDEYDLDEPSKVIQQREEAIVNRAAKLAASLNGCVAKLNEQAVVGAAVKVGYHKDKQSRRTYFSGTIEKVVSVAKVIDNKEVINAVVTVYFPAQKKFEASTDTIDIDEWFRFE